jgi:SPP1 gp7 family putative phage head morphogenesis protein
MQASLKKGGFTVPFKPTRASIEAYKAVAAENIALIKSIPARYHTDVQAQVWESVKRGGDLKTVSEKLHHTYGVTRRRAALIARDQNAKAKATIEAVRHQELGIKQAIWMHSHAGKTPRPTHVKMNRKLYNLDRGMWDEDELEWVHPGQLINCRCTMRPYIPGFEKVAYPEWDITQT